LNPPQSPFEKGGLKGGFGGLEEIFTKGGSTFPFPLLKGGSTFPFPLLKGGDEGEVYNRGNQRKGKNKV
jgi:hypothetical protein